MRRLLLVRHGETAWNKERRLQGQEDIPLSQRGLEQARALAPVVRPFAPATVISSDLARARQTAEALGYADCRSDVRLREADLGAWVGISATELMATRAADYLAWRAGTLTPEGAESFEVLVDRVRPALREIVAAPGPVLIVSHGGVVRAALAILLDLYPDRLVPVSPASLTVVDVPAAWPDAGSDCPKLHSYNLTGYAALEPAPD